MKIALIGLGAVGQALVTFLAASGAGVQVLGALVSQQKKEPGAVFPTFGRLEALLETGPDLVVECARQHVLKELGPRVLEGGVNLLAASAGALADASTEAVMRQAALSGLAQLFIPAGAIAGIDALAAARQAGLSKVNYIRRAPPSTWVKSGALDAAKAATLREPLVVFEGSAREAATRYPKNANVTATIALAGVGFERTRVILLADPAANSNVHLLEAQGAFGRFSTEMMAQPIAGSTSSSIVAGSLAHAVLARASCITV